MPTATDNSKDTVATPSTAYMQMQAAGSWTLLSALRGGTRAMRAMGKEFLPQEPRESETAYKCRLERSILYGVYDDTIKKLTSKPFSRPVTITGLADDRLGMIEVNVDRRTRCDITQFARQLLDTGVDRGLCHILVEYPNTTEGVETLKDERDKDIRPYFIEIHPDDLIAWEEDEQTGHITSIRYRKSTIEKDGEFKDQVVERVVHYTSEFIATYKFNPTDKTWQRDGEERLNTLGRVPLVTAYFEKEDAMTAEPPLLNLAWLNLAHWQSYSDHRNILRFSRFGLLFGSGLDEEDSKNLEIGPNRLITAKNPEAKLQYVEHTGAAIKVGENDLERLVNQMEVLGLQPLISRPGQKTATEKSIDEAKGQSTLQSWVRALEALLEQAYETAGNWIGIKMPDGFSVDIFNEFGLSAVAHDDVKTLLELRKGREITQATLLSEIQRRGTLRDELDIEAEIALTQQEAANDAAALADLMKDDDDEEIE